MVPLPGERVLVSFRNLSTVAIIDKRTGAFVWKLGSEMLAQQHDPSPHSTQFSGWEVPGHTDSRLT